MVLVKPGRGFQMNDELEEYELSRQIQSNRELEEKRMPANYQSSWGYNCDVTSGQDGQPAKGVRKPPNPEDNYE